MIGKIKKCEDCIWFTWACPNWMCMNPNHPDFEEDSDYPIMVERNDSCELFEAGVQIKGQQK